MSMPSGGAPATSVKASSVLARSTWRPLARQSRTIRIDLISPRPLLMVAGREAVTDYFSREAIEQTFAFTFS
jgi:hypothetical protein